MEYLLKSSGLVIILVVFYNLFLKNETFFTSIRSYFLIGSLIIITVPLIEIPIYIQEVASQSNALNFATIDIKNSNIENSINWIQLITQIYVLGVLFFGSKFIAQLLSLLILIIKHKTIKQGNLYYIETSKNIAPFSFFNIIIYNKQQFTIEELEQIMNHEKIHVNQWHSFDTILSHLLVILLWFNPFAWYFKKLTLQNLEFLADSCALNKSKNQQLYKFTLLKASTRNFNISITNNFYNSLIKKRIIMLHTNKSKNNKQWKYALLIPVLIAFISTFNTKTIAQNVKHSNINNNLKFEVIIDKNVNETELNEMESYFNNEFNIDLSFKGIKRNTNNEILAIKIDAKGKNTQAKFENSGTLPILPIKISYNSEFENITIGNVTLKKEKKHSYTYNIEGDKVDENGEVIFVTKDSTKIKWVSKSETDTLHLKGKNSVRIYSDNASEDVKIITIEDNDKNVFIIKSDGNSINKQKINKNSNVILIDSKKDEPIYFVNGKEIKSEESKNIDPNTIESINVLKGKNAIDKYGEKAKNGVIEILTKKE